MKLTVKFAGIFAVLAFALTAVSADAAFTRDLTLGSTGTDVTELQNVLISAGYSIPAGATGYFGAQTQSALAKWQAAVGIVPAAGYFGPISKAKLAMSGTPSTPDEDDDSDTGSDDLSGGDGDFNDFDVLGNPDSTDVEEGATEEVLSFEFDAEDSDLLIERLDVLFGETSSSTDKPWKVLDTITVSIDGEEVADIDASDSDVWDEEENDEYSVRFEDIDTKIEDGETAKVVVSVTAQDSLDADDLGDWSVEIMNDGVRALNADGIQVYEGNSTDDINASSDERTFTLEEAQAGDMDVNVDEDDNNDRVVAVDEDNDTNDEVLYVATVESNDGDNTIEEVTVTIATTTGTTDDLADFVSTLYLFIDGEEVGSESVDGTASEAITFDDINVEVAEDEELDFEVRADFNSQDGNYATTTTGVQVTNVVVDYVDQNDDDQSVPEATDGGVISLSLDSIMVETSSLEADYSGDTSTKGKYTIKFDVTAPENDDIYIALSSAGTSYEIVNAATGATTTATTTSASLTGSTITSSHLKIAEGQTKTLTLTVYLDNLGGATDKELQVGLTQVSYKVGSTGATADVYTSGLDEDYRTDSLVLFKAAQN